MSVEVTFSNAGVAAANEKKRITFSAARPRGSKAARGEELTALLRKSAAREFFVKKRRLESGDRTHTNLPDYSEDWWLLEGAEDASSAEIEARFYYEFARESETILRLTEGLSQGLRPLELGVQLFAMVHGLVPGYVLGSQLRNLREISWNALKPCQKEAIISAFIPKRMAFRQLADQEPFPPAQKGPSSPQIERQAFPMEAHSGGESFRLRDNTGAKNPKRKYLTALRGLGAMRLLGRRTLLKATHITKGYGRKGDSLYCGFLLDTGEPAGRSAWKKGIENARKIFKEVFYPRDEKLLSLRLSYNLPEI